jgi:predicted ATPase
MSPFLRSVELDSDRIVPGEYPFHLPIFSRPFQLRFESTVTILVGENGSGKSTLLEALAQLAGFDIEGGSRQHRPRWDDKPASALVRALRLAWSHKGVRGFFLRAESFYKFAEYLDRQGSTFHAYGGKSLLEQSHGESFLALFRHNFEDGLYLLDEPEAALSPNRQLAFLAILHDLTRHGGAQFVMATHSPILMAFPGARIVSLDSGQFAEVDYRDTEHYRVTRSFLEAPERYFRHLFGEDE